MRDTPIAVFTYNRPNHAERVLASLAQCSRLDECDVHIFSDGPKTGQQAAVAATRRVTAGFSTRLKAQIIERENNLGLAHSIVAGVSALVEQYGRVIVLEDDLVVSRHLVDYMLQALDRYAREPKVFQVSGYSFPVSPVPTAETLFLPLSTTWGWATWDRAWRVFDWTPPRALEMLADPQQRRRFDLDGSYPFAAMLEQRMAAQNDSWGILWWYAVFRANALVLYPQRSLVRNDGFDGTGVHSGDSRQLSQSLYADISQVSLATPLAFPKAAELDPVVFESFKQFLRGQQTQLQNASILRRLRHRLRLRLRGQFSRKAHP